MVQATDQRGSAAGSEILLAKMSGAGRLLAKSSPAAQAGAAPVLAASDSAGASLIPDALCYPFR
jgi:hypothetical protein